MLNKVTDNNQPLLCDKRQIKGKAAKNCKSEVALNSSLEFQLLIYCWQIVKTIQQPTRIP